MGRHSWSSRDMVMVMAMGRRDISIFVARTLCNPARRQATCLDAVHVTNGRQQAPINLNLAIHHRDNGLVKSQWMECWCISVGNATRKEDCYELDEKRRC
ncbi:hypothetical protein GQ607_013650 [Colletotrichum asianum]|uniref:Uncharacterized protein n=1 Tax=Colletotrichum asianum TaxID=702518 RepID=A0A8H3W350_9PEZI|nr:hypothetical protein GQ607_013650 [Colletotrichum asianum]